MKKLFLIVSLLCAASECFAAHRQHHASHDRARSRLGRATALHPRNIFEQPQQHPLFNQYQQPAVPHSAFPSEEYFYYQQQPLSPPQATQYYNPTGYQDPYAAQYFQPQHLVPAILYAQFQSAPPATFQHPSFSSPVAQLLMKYGTTNPDELDQDFHSPIHYALFAQQPAHARILFAELARDKKISLCNLDNKKSLLHTTLMMITRCSEEDPILPDLLACANDFILCTDIVKKYGTDGFTESPWDYLTTVMQHNPAFSYLYNACQLAHGQRIADYQHSQKIPVHAPRQHLQVAAPAPLFSASPLIPSLSTGETVATQPNIQVQITVPEPVANIDSITASFSTASITSDPSKSLSGSLANSIHQDVPQNSPHMLTEESPPLLTESLTSSVHRETLATPPLIFTFDNTQASASPTPSSAATQEQKTKKPKKSFAEGQADRQQREADRIRLTTEKAERERIAEENRKAEARKKNEEARLRNEAKRIEREAAATAIKKLKEEKKKQEKDARIAAQEAAKQDALQARIERILTLKEKLFSTPTIKNFVAINKQCAKGSDTSILKEALTNLSSADKKDFYAVFFKEACTQEARDLFELWDVEAFITLDSATRSHAEEIGLLKRPILTFSKQEIALFQQNIGEANLTFLEKNIEKYRQLRNPTQDYEEHDFYSAIFTTILIGNIQSLRFFASHAHDVSLKSKHFNGHTPLIFLLQTHVDEWLNHKKRHYSKETLLEAVKIFAEHPSYKGVPNKLNEQNNALSTVLHFAAGVPDTELVIDYLYERGCEISLTLCDKEGSTPFDIAFSTMACPSAEVLKALFKHPSLHERILDIFLEGRKVHKERLTDLMKILEKEPKTEEHLILRLARALGKINFLPCLMRQGFHSVVIDLLEADLLTDEELLEPYSQEPKQPYEKYNVMGQTILMLKQAVENRGTCYCTEMKLLQKLREKISFDVWCQHDSDGFLDRISRELAPKIKGHHEHMV